MGIFNLDGVEPTLPDGDFCWIADSAVVAGNVIISRDVGIWFGAVLRGDNEPIAIGEGTNIQENCILHTDMGFPLTIGAGCTIGHGAILHGCEIADNSLIGMGATVLNGAKIGKNCVIGAGALVTENKIIPDNSLVVGSPGRVARNIDGETEEQLKEGAANYVRNAKRFANGLKEIK